MKNSPIRCTILLSKIVLLDWSDETGQGPRKTGRMRLVPVCVYPIQDEMVLTLENKLALCLDVLHRNLGYPLV